MRQSAKPKADPDAVTFASNIRRLLGHAFEFAKDYLIDERGNATSIHHLLYKFQEPIWETDPKLLVENRQYINLQIHEEFLMSSDDRLKRPINQFWAEFVIEIIDEQSKLLNNPNITVSPEMQLQADIQRYSKLRSIIAESLKLKGFTSKVIDFPCSMDLRKPEILAGFNMNLVDKKFKVFSLSDNLHEMWKGDSSRRIRTPLPNARKIALSVLSHFRSKDGQLQFRKISSVEHVMDRAFGDSIMLLAPGTYIASAWIRIVFYIVRTVYEMFVEMHGEAARPYASNMAVALLGVMNEYYQLDESVLLICDYLPGATENSNRGEVCWNVLSTILGWSEDLTPLWFNKIPSDFQMNQSTQGHYLKFFKIAQQLTNRALVKQQVDLAMCIEDANISLKGHLTFDPDSEFMRPPHRQVLSRFVDQNFPKASWNGMKEIWLDLALYSSYISIHHDLFFIDFEKRYTKFWSALNKCIPKKKVNLTPIYIADLKQSSVFKDFNPKRSCNQLSDYCGDRRKIFPGDFSHPLGQIKPPAISLVNEVLLYLKDGGNGVIDIPRLFEFTDAHEWALVDSVYVFGAHNVPRAYALIVCLGRCLMEIMIALECNKSTAIRIGYIFIATLCLAFRASDLPPGVQVSLDMFRLPIHQEGDFELRLNIISMHLGWQGWKPATVLFHSNQIEMEGKWEHYNDFIHDKVRFRITKDRSVKYDNPVYKPLLNPPPEKLSVSVNRVSQELKKVHQARQNTEVQLEIVQSLLGMIENRVNDQIERMHTANLLIETSVGVSNIEPSKRSSFLEDYEGDNPLVIESVPPVTVRLQQHVDETIADFRIRIGRECMHYGDRVLVSIFINGLKDTRIRRLLLDKEFDACEQFSPKEAAVAAQFLADYQSERRGLKKRLDDLTTAL